MYFFKTENNHGLISSPVLTHSLCQDVKITHPHSTVIESSRDMVIYIHSFPGTEIQCGSDVMQVHSHFTNSLKGHRLVPVASIFLLINKPDCAGVCYSNQQWHTANRETLQALTHPFWLHSSLSFKSAQNLPCSSWVHLSSSI